MSKWTNEDLAKNNDYQFVASVLAERAMKLNPFTPFAKRLMKCSRILYEYGSTLSLDEELAFKHTTK